MLPLALTLSCLALWPIAAMALARVGAARPLPVARFDAIVVLGCRVLPDGSAGPGLARRVALAAELYRAGLAPTVVLSGGQVGGPVTEARAALPLLLSGGVPEHAVRLEERSRSTLENARFTLACVGEQRLLLVTHAYHAPRARILFRRVFRDVASAGVPSAIEVRGALREVPLFVLTWLRLA